MADATCSTDGCNAIVYARAWCKRHYQQWWRTQPSENRRKLRSPGPCAVPGCERPRRKRDWCEMHYTRWRKRGSVEDADQAWVWAEFDVCIVCSGPIPDGGEFRRYCSRSCAVLENKGSRVTSRPCSQCGATIDLVSRHPSGRMKHANAKVCGACRGISNLRRYVPVLVERDGTDCGICREPVDLSLAYPDPLSRSVDHVIPRARGGPDDLTNYQLSHLACNVRKQDRIDAS